MPEKDASEKRLEAYNDVFADIVNVLLFNGEEVIKPDELIDQAPRSTYKTDGKLHEMERDVAKRWQKQNIRIACIGLENQTKIDMDMPLRVIGYDGAEYRSELDGKERYPVVTLVLYFGERHWSKLISLLDCFDVPEKFRRYVNDYKINVFEIAYLSDEQVKLFKSDFGIVADYFVQMQKTKDYVPDPIQLRHVHETLQLMSVLTNDYRYEEAYNDSQKGEFKTMSEILDKMINKGRAEGLEQGVISSIANLMDSMRLTMEQAMEALKVPLDKRGVYAQMLKEYQG